MQLRRVGGDVEEVVVVSGVGSGCRCWEWVQVANAPLYAHDFVLIVSEEGDPVFQPAG